MYEAMPAYRPELKPQTPRIEQLIIDREFIGAVIGPGGKIIQEIQRTTGAEINIEEVGEIGVVKVFSNNGESLNAAMNWIKGIVAIPEVGEVYESTVKSIMPYGAFVEFMPGKQGLLHISEVSWKRLETLEGVLNENEVIKVKLLGVDQKTGKFRLSRKVLMPKPEGYVEQPEGERKPRRENGDRGDRRDRNDRGDRGGDRRNDRGDRKPREQAEAQNTQPVNNENPAIDPSDADLAL
ncbi:Polyribonucleotide nucleotidyltransferase [compost metagenome]